MNKKITLVSLFALVALMLAVSACGGSAPATINDIPAYPGATELKAGDSRIGDTLAKNMQNDAALRQAAGAGGKQEQRGFSVAKDTSWDAVKKFYDEKLKATGWGAPNSMVSNVMAQVNQQNPMTQSEIYARGKQTVAVVRVVEPISKDVMLILVLTTN